MDISEYLTRHVVGGAWGVKTDYMNLVIFLKMWKKLNLAAICDNMQFIP